MRKVEEEMGAHWEYLLHLGIVNCRRDVLDIPVSRLASAYWSRRQFKFCLTVKLSQTHHGEQRPALLSWQWCPWITSMSRMTTNLFQIEIACWVLDKCSKTSKEISFNTAKLTHLCPEVTVIHLACATLTATWRLAYDINHIHYVLDDQSPCANKIMASNVWKPEWPSRTGTTGRLYVHEVSQWYKVVPMI